MELESDLEMRKKTLCTNIKGKKDREIKHGVREKKSINKQRR